MPRNLQHEIPTKVNKNFRNALFHIMILFSRRWITSLSYRVNALIHTFTYSRTTKAVNKKKFPQHYITIQLRNWPQKKNHIIEYRVIILPLLPKNDNNEGSFPLNVWYKEDVQVPRLLISAILYSLWNVTMVFWIADQDDSSGSLPNYNRGSSGPPINN